MTKSQLKQLIRETIDDLKLEATPPSTGRIKEATQPEWMVTFSSYGIGGTEEEFSVVVRGANEQAAISNGKRYVQRHKEELIGYERDILNDLESVKAEPLKQ
jgi:hypothetical protein